MKDVCLFGIITGEHIKEKNPLDMKSYKPTAKKQCGAGQRLEQSIGIGQMAGKHPNSNRNLVIKGTQFSISEDGKYY